MDRPADMVGDQGDRDRDARRLMCNVCRGCHRALVDLKATIHSHGLWQSLDGGKMWGRYSWLARSHLRAKPELGIL